MKPTLVIVLNLSCLSCCLAAIPPYLFFNENSIHPDDVVTWKDRLLRLQNDATNRALSYGSYDNNVILKYRQWFDEFVSLFQRTYIENVEESEKRFEIFVESLHRHNLLNGREAAINGTARYGINKFSDWTTSEFLGILRSRQDDSISQRTSSFRPHTSRSHERLQPCSYYSINYPQKVDWRSKLTRIKDQGSCGSCWAFVGSEQVESYWAIKSGKIVERSPQQLLSCSPSLGCEGGNTCAALEWLTKMEIVLATEAEYPYQEKDSACHSVNSTTTGPRVQAVCGCRSLVNNEVIMLRVIHQKGPLSVNVDAVQWHDYIGGIIQHHCTNKNMNHAVQLVGYDLVSDRVPYWLAKNQWGSSFGEDGYVRVTYGENMCGIAEQPSFIKLY